MNIQGCFPLGLTALTSLQPLGSTRKPKTSHLPSGSLQFAAQTTRSVKPLPWRWGLGACFSQGLPLPLCPVLSHACDPDKKPVELPWDLGMAEVTWTSDVDGPRAPTHPVRLISPPLQPVRHPPALQSPPHLFPLCLVSSWAPPETCSSSPICCLRPSRKVSALFNDHIQGEEERRPGVWKFLGKSSLESAADGGGPSGAHVDESLGGNPVPAALACCHPVFPSPSESLNFAHLS